ncbi:MAG: hypothetical protein RJA07_682 [Bacteroidota bacterium]|jgi:hypothetical protein
MVIIKAYRFKKESYRISLRKYLMEIFNLSPKQSKAIIDKISLNELVEFTIRKEMVNEFKTKLIEYGVVLVEQ